MERSIKIGNVFRHSPPRRGGEARQLNRSWRAGVARSASPLGRSLNRSSAQPPELTTPSAPSLRSAHPLLRLRPIGLARCALLCAEGCCWGFTPLELIIVTAILGLLVL